MDKPYIEEFSSEHTYIRTFPEDTLEEELKWHWDEEDRRISPIEETDWLFQMDNELPQKIEGEIFIPKGVFHRIIKGNGELKILVHKIF
jgi:hypothetical protein